MQNEINPLRNRIVFEASIEDVTDSIAKMNLIMKKVCNAGTRSVSINSDGFLFFSGEKMANVKGVLRNTKVRKDRAFKFLSKEEVDSFFHILSFLMENNINGVYECYTTGLYVYNYRETIELRSDDLREIILIEMAKDTNTAKFDRTYKILDSESKMILVAPKGARIN